jgi:hypothetical protein
MPLTSIFSETKATYNINCPFKIYDQYVKKKNYSCLECHSDMCNVSIYLCCMFNARFHIAGRDDARRSRSNTWWRSKGEAEDEGASGDNVEAGDEGASGDKGDGAAMRAGDEDEVEADQRRGRGRGRVRQSQG